MGVSTSIISWMSMQRKRRLPVGSVSRAAVLLVPMNEAMRGRVTEWLRYALRIRSEVICIRFFKVLCLRDE